ncbi:YetF domain-containing protein [Desulfosporosinus shakirovi]|uniref:YetF domain-containing protein n=1 Tax=Desulfosporosinus shakirovi TaxID=2885154 RepID=UPI00289AB0EF|nr:YetF domain-containing protein [Desulfosporosinus sp. SRJS8]MCB8814994.1 DUF421 domain-containing protein [Desulfosporosinus sp. SRJS8]
MRLTIDKLETRLRQAGVSSIEDVRYATIEVSGQLGYELKDNKKPVTREDFMLLMAELSQIKQSLGYTTTPAQTSKNQSNNIFVEVDSHQFEDENEP